jgi:predicted acyl esterase
VAAQSRHGKDALLSRRRQAQLRSSNRAQRFDEYLSDPNHPVPFVGYTTDTVPQRYMVDDQRFASYRPDVLTYETDPLTRM